MKPTTWIPVSNRLPPEGKYVLIHLTKENWVDDTDHDGVYFKVAKLEHGLSIADRERMRSGDLPDPNNRSFHWSAADEHANNERPYVWRTFGPGDYFGQEVDYWMEIPELP